MSFAVIQTGGKQYKVKAGEILKIEKLDNLKANSKIEFKEILAYGDDKTAEIGAPKIDGAKVEANLVKNGKNRTILILKKRRRKNCIYWRYSFFIRLWKNFWGNLWTDV